MSSRAGSSPSDTAEVVTDQYSVSDVEQGRFGSAWTRLPARADGSGDAQRRRPRPIRNQRGAQPNEFDGVLPSTTCGPQWAPTRLGHPPDAEEDSPHSKSAIDDSAG